jgi:hypothetical protein
LFEKSPAKPAVSDDLASSRVGSRDLSRLF